LAVDGLLVGVGWFALMVWFTCCIVCLSSHSLFVLDLSLNCFEFRGFFGDPVHIGLTNTSHIFLRGARVVCRGFLLFAWLLVLFSADVLFCVVARLVCR
jgi:hypothetical protein